MSFNSSKSTINLSFNTLRKRKSCLGSSKDGTNSNCVRNESPGNLMYPEKCFSNASTKAASDANQQSESTLILLQRLAENGTKPKDTCKWEETQLFPGGSR